MLMKMLTQSIITPNQDCACDNQIFNILLDRYICVHRLIEWYLKVKDLPAWYIGVISVLLFFGSIIIYK